MQHHGRRGQGCEGRRRQGRARSQGRQEVLSDIPSVDEDPGGNAMRTAPASKVIQQQTSTLADDFQDVVTDAQELLETMGTEGGAKVIEMKKRVQASIDAARKQLGELQVSVTEGARAAVK